jgi:SAM-dependent methyltransferase
LKKLLSEDSRPADGPSFGERFRAWWEGYELDPGQEQEVAPAGQGGEESGGKQDRYTPVDRSSPWPDTRQKVAQLVWGNGFVGPGDADSAIEMVQAIGLDASSNMLEIGAGVGGGTRAVAALFGAYVTGWDLEPELAAEATIQAEVHSLELKAAVKPLDPEQVEFKANFHAGALIRETLYRIADKKSFLAKVIESLKPGGHLLISDLFFADDAATSEMDRWRDGERSEAYGWRIDEAREVLAKLSVDVRVATDDSDAYCAEILAAWKSFVPTVGDDALGVDLVLPMVDEAEFWARRLAAIQSGDLRIFRITCLKKKLVA